MEHIREKSQDFLEKMMYIECPFVMLSPSHLNNFVCVVDTVGSNDRVSSDQQDFASNQEKGSYYEIYCMSLSGGFNKNHTEEIKELYRNNPNPSNVLFSFNLSNYLRVEEGEFTNIDELLEQFLNRIPAQFIEIF